MHIVARWGHAVVVTRTRRRRSRALWVVAVRGRGRRNHRGLRRRWSKVWRAVALGRAMLLAATSAAVLVERHHFRSEEL